MCSTFPMAWAQEARRRGERRDAAHLHDRFAEKRGEEEV